MLEPCLADGRDVAVAELPIQVDAVDLGTDRPGNRAYVDPASHGSAPPWPDRLQLADRWSDLAAAVAARQARCCLSGGGGGGAHAAPPRCSQARRRNGLSTSSPSPRDPCPSPR